MVGMPPTITGRSLPFGKPRTIAGSSLPFMRVSWIDVPRHTMQ
jgi:hypothetical protein